MTSTQTSSSTSEACGSELDDLRRRVAELSDAVAARDTFITVAAHELRNPMTPILGQITLLLASIRANRCSFEQAEQRLTRVEKTVRQYMKRAVVLLDVSRMNSGKFRLEAKACDLAELLRDIVEDFTDVAHHAGVVITLQSPVTCPGHFDRMAVEQVVDNLVSNAIKYGGRSPVAVHLLAGDEHVEILVRDQGRGIAPEHRQRIFERFERAIGRNEIRSGFGVGLWVVGQLVDAMSGSITIDDAPGGGALFRVTLPLQTKEAL